jgi:hypothetical protein
MILRDKQDIGLESLSNSIGVSYAFLRAMVDDHTKKKYRKLKIQQIEKVYRYYRIPVDDFYIQNLQKRYRPSQSVIGNLFMVLRIQKGRTREEVARMIKGDARSITRIETGETLPSYKGYYIVKLIELYEIKDEDKTNIERFICNLKTVIEILKKYDAKGFSFQALGIE